MVTSPYPLWVKSRLRLISQHDFCSCGFLLIYKIAESFGKDVKGCDASCVRGAAVFRHAA